MKNTHQRDYGFAKFYGGLCLTVLVLMFFPLSDSNNVESIRAFVILAIMIGVIPIAVWKTNARKTED